MTIFDDFGVPPPPYQRLIKWGGVDKKERCLVAPLIHQISLFDIFGVLSGLGVFWVFWSFSMVLHAGFAKNGVFGVF